MKKVILLLITILLVQCSSNNKEAVDINLKDAFGVYSVKDAINLAKKGKYVYLYLEGDESKEFPKEFENIPKDKLIGLTLDNCKFSSYPSYMSEFNNLILLEFLWYLDDASLPIKEIPEFVFELTNLEILKFERIRFSEIDSDITNLKNLRSLSFYGSNLKEFPEDILELENLEELNLSCNEFTSIPSEITKLTKLKILKFEGGACGATPLESLPENIGDLKNLEYLSLGYTKKPIKKLPNSFYQLKNLNDFECHGCGLEELSNEISNLKKLTSISLTNLNHFNALPSSFFNLPNINSFRLHVTDIKTKDILIQKNKIDLWGAKILNYEIDLHTDDEILNQYLYE